MVINDLAACGTSLQACLQVLIATTDTPRRAEFFMSNTDGH